MKKASRGLMICLAVAAGWLLSPAYDACAQGSTLFRLELPSSFNVVGSGAEALGMGGAGISLIEDATAASWNPGSLVRLPNFKPELSVVGAYVYRSEENSFGSFADGDFDESVSEANLNYLSFLWPFYALNRKMVVSLNYQHLYEFNRDWDFSVPTQEPFLAPVGIDYEQDGDLYALGLAYGVDLYADEESRRRFSAGVTANYWGDFINDNQWEQKYRYEYTANLNGVTSTTHYDLKHEYDFEGVNFNLGFLWQLDRHWRIGGVFKTPFDADVDHRISGRERVAYAEDSGLESDYSFQDKGPVDEIRMPMSYGLGVSYTLDPWMFGLDVYRTQWDDFEYRNRDGTRTCPITGKSMGESDVDATTWVRLGAVYSFEKSRSLDTGATPGHATKLRLGLFYDPAPAEGSPDDYYGCSAGIGYAFKDFAMDFAYQFRFGNDVGSSGLENLDFTQDVYEHTFYVSIVYHAPYSPSR